jgi:hypothetical protein
MRFTLVFLGLPGEITDKRSFRVKVRSFEKFEDGAVGEDESGESKKKRKRRKSKKGEGASKGKKKK